MTANIRAFPTQAAARKAQRVNARVLATAIEQMVAATLPHTPNSLTEPMVEVQIHTPGADGELIAAFQLPEPIADELTFVVRRVTAKAEALSVEHSRIADTAPVRALRSIPGGAGR